MKTFRFTLYAGPFDGEELTLELPMENPPPWIHRDVGRASAVYIPHKETLTQEGTVYVYKFLEERPGTTSVVSHQINT